MRRVHIELSGGLGNQLFQAAAAISFAREHGAEAIGYFGRHFAKSSHGNNIFELDWSGQLTLETPSEAEVLKRTIMFRGSHAFGVSGRKRDGYVWSKSPDLSVVDIPRERLFLRGYFQNSDFILKNQDFVFPQLKSASPEYQKALEVASRTNPLGVHIRLGDYLKHSDTHGVLPAGYYSSAFNSLPPEDRDRPIWVFSDDESSAIQLLTAAGVGSRLLPASRFGLVDLETMFLLAHCKSLILGNSTFSLWSGLLHNGGGPVFRPEPPFIGLEVHPRFFPERFSAINISWHES